MNTTPQKKSNVSKTFNGKFGAFSNILRVAIKEDPRISYVIHTFWDEINTYPRALYKLRVMVALNALNTLFDGIEKVDLEEADHARIRDIVDDIYEIFDII